MLPAKPLKKRYLHFLTKKISARRAGRYFKKRGLVSVLETDKVCTFYKGVKRGCWYKIWGDFIPCALILGVIIHHSYIVTDNYENSMNEM